MGGCIFPELCTRTFVGTPYAPRIPALASAVASLSSVWGRSHPSPGTPMTEVDLCGWSPGPACGATHLSSTTTWGKGQLIPILQTRRLRHRERRECVQRHTVSLTEPRPFVLCHLLWPHDPSQGSGSGSCKARHEVTSQPQPPLMPPAGPLPVQECPPPTRGLASMKPGGIPHLGGLQCPLGVPCPQAAPFKVPLSPLFPCRASVSPSLHLSPASHSQARPWKLSLGQR